MMRSGRLLCSASFAMAATSDSAVTTRQPQLFSKPRVPSRTSSSSSITMTSLSRSESTRVRGTSKRACAIPAGAEATETEKRDPLPTIDLVDRMIKETTEAIDDGQAEAKPAAVVLLLAIDLIELAEDVTALILGDADPA